VKKLLGIATILFVLGPAASAAQAYPYVTAHRILATSDARTWYGTCYSANGRYAGSVYDYLQRAPAGANRRWNQQGVSGSGSDFATGGAPRNATVTLGTEYYRGSDGYGPFFSVDAATVQLDSYGTFSVTAAHPLAAGWFWHTGLKEWYLEAEWAKFDFNGDLSTDCMVYFAYGYPWLAPNNKRPAVPKKPPPWYPEKGGFPGP
jgi:hypothetical protein